MRKFHKRSAKFLKVFAFPEMSPTEIDMSTFDAKKYDGFLVHKMGNKEMDELH